MASITYLNLLIMCIVFCCLTSVFSQRQLFRGNPCQLASKASPGICKAVNDCPSALAEIRTGKNPQICTFEKNTAIVCCPEKTQEVKTGKSAQKCAEYVKEAELPVLSASARSTFHTTVVGGTKAAKSEFPHMANIGYGPENQKKWLCGGSLISDRYVVTAAHCISTEFGPASWIQLGLLNKNNVAQAQNFAVEKSIRHPDYRSPAVYNDIALLRTDRAVFFSSTVRPACLYTSKYVPGKQAVATGWGLVEFGGKPSSDLLKVTLDLFTHRQCKDVYGTSNRKFKNGILDESQICYGSFTSDKDTCQGDSGGPLQAKRADSCCIHDLVGITSFGKVCGTSNVPGVYTRVSHFVPWIESVVWP